MSKVTLGNVVIDRDRYEAWVDGRLIRLTFVEFELLWELARHAPAVISRRHLLRTVWHEATAEHSRKINIQVCRLRRKLAGSDWQIETHSKRGYALAATRAQEPGSVPVPLAGLVLFVNKAPSFLNNKIEALFREPLLLLRPSSAMVATIAVLVAAILSIAIDSIPVAWGRLALMMHCMLIIVLVWASNTRSRAVARLKRLRASVDI